MLIYQLKIDDALASNSIMFQPTSEQLFASKQSAYDYAMSIYEEQSERYQTFVNKLLESSDSSDFTIDKSNISLTYNSVSDIDNLDLSSLNDSLVAEICVTYNHIKKKAYTQMRETKRHFKITIQQLYVHD